jgi:hypothetical protein
MNPLKIIHLLITIVFIPASTLAGDKHALLIGIQDYSRSGISSLKGSINDIILMEGVLRERLGLRDQDFIILLDAQATHTGIAKAFTALIEKVKSDDFVYIHYSGYGSQTPDLNGDEPRNGKDQTWVSYGARTHPMSKDINNYDVLDDEINAWLAKIYAKTKQVIFVSDSCNEAIVARGAAPSNRAAKKDNRKHPLGKSAYTQIEKNQGIRVSAARDNESAVEIMPREEGKIYGLFTWYWAKALQQAQAGETWSDVFKRTYTPIASWRGQAQIPLLSGEHNRKFLDGLLSPLTSTISVSDAYHRYINIRAGYTAGVTVGSVYRLYNPQHPNNKKLPRFTVSGVKAFMSYGFAPKVGLFKKGDLVIEESHAYHFDPIKVYLSADYPKGKDKPLLQIIRTAFDPHPNGKQAFPGYIPTEDPYNTDLRLHLLRPKRKKNGQPIHTLAEEALPKYFPNQPPELWILTPEQKLLDKNLQIQFENLRSGMKLLQNYLKKVARLRELKMLHSTHSTHSSNTLPILVQTTVLSPVNYCPQNAKCVKLPDSLGWHRKTGQYNLQEIEGRTLNQNDLLTFTLHNRSKLDYYCYLMNIGIDGAISAIFPAKNAPIEYARVRAGEKRDSRLKFLRRKNFNLELTFPDGVLMLERIGEESLLVITSIRPIDVRLFEKTGFKRSFVRALNSLERLLVNALHGIRGAKRVRIKVRNNEWATGLATFEVKAFTRTTVSNGD